MRLIDADKLHEYYDTQIKHKVFFDSELGHVRPFVDIADVFKAINEQPTVCEWIPCSERLPEDSGYYLVTYHSWSNGNYLPKFNDTYVRRLHYQNKRFVGWNFPAYDDDKAENDINREVIAWMPLPEPHKEEQDGDLINKKSTILAL